ncbi:MAG: hypothetical protein J2P15_22955, partial [Micromonosporaceae bacterium]|nr:hypothetical protein [Micromonosporaceae bacterium]
WLSRRAGELVALDRGLWVTNASHSHALYVVGEDYRIRLPPLAGTRPTAGAVIVAGAAQVGSAQMVAHGRAVRATVHARQSTGGPVGPAVLVEGEQSEDVEITVRSLELDRGTKVFLVAFVLCRPWLTDAGRVTSLPNAPQIARSILEIVNAWQQLARFDADRAVREHLSEQVNDHLKYLRRRMLASGLVPHGTRLTPAVTVELLLANDIVTRADLDLLESPDWRSVQENLWWGDTH